MLTKHFVIARKRMCNDGNLSCIQDAENWGKVVFVIQAEPRILIPEWRNKNRFIQRNYLGQDILFDTEKLYEEMKQHGQPKCKCVNSLLLRSNDGITTENPEEEKLL